MARNVAFRTTPCDRQFSPPLLIDASLITLMLAFR